jgi:Tfp pilus assembly protein PilX
MNRKNEKGFALILSLVLLLVMSLMGGSLIVISSGDHQSNNTSDDYQQTFYVAETALLEGEKYLLNQFLGPWKADATRDATKRNLPRNCGPSSKPISCDAFEGAMVKKNYDKDEKNHKNLSTNMCFNSFADLDRKKLAAEGVVVAESWNFGILLKESFGQNTSDQEKEEADLLKVYFYEYFVQTIGSAPFRGYGSSVKKGQQDTGHDGMAYRVYGCGLNSKADRMVVALESTVVLPK